MRNILIAAILCAGHSAWACLGAPAEIRKESQADFGGIQISSDGVKITLSSPDFGDNIFEYREDKGQWCTFEPHREDVPSSHHCYGSGPGSIILAEDASRLTKSSIRSFINGREYKGRIAAEIVINGNQLAIYSLKSGYCNGAVPAGCEFLRDSTPSHLFVTQHSVSGNKFQSILVGESEASATREITVTKSNSRGLESASRGCGATVTDGPRKRASSTSSGGRSLGHQ